MAAAEKHEPLTVPAADAGEVNVDKVKGNVRPENCKGHEFLNRLEGTQINDDGTFWNVKCRLCGQTAYQG